MKIVYTNTLEKMEWKKLKKDDIFKILESHNFNKEEIIIISGAAMVIRNYKEETDDIDISVSKKYYEELLKTKKCTLERIIDGIHIWFIDDIINFSTNFYNSEYSEINGYKVQTIKSVIELKKSLGRKKDLIDIERIQKKYGKINISLLNELSNIFDDCTFYLDGKCVVEINNIKSAIKDAKQIKILLSEDMMMAFDREYAGGFYRPDWDITIDNFENCVKNYNCKWHMPYPWTILIEDSSWKSSYK